MHLNYTTTLFSSRLQGTSEYCIFWENSWGAEKDTYGKMSVHIDQILLVVDEY